MEIDDKLETYRKKYGIENLSLLQVDSFESFAINPELPYKNTWTEMGTKDILKYAAENDMDFIAVPIEEKTIRKIEKWPDQEEAPIVLEAILDRNETYIPRAYSKLVGKQHPPIKTAKIRDADGYSHKVKVMYFPKELRKEYLDKIKSGKIGAYKDGGLIDQTRQMFNKGGEVTEERLAIQEEDQPIVESISRRLKTDPDTLRSNLGEVKQAIKKHETGNQNIYQIVDGAARGPGAGYYQFEQKQFGGSGAAKTAVNRTLNTYKFLNQTAPQWLQNLAKDPDPDFTQLDERQQDLIFLGNLNQEKGSDKLMRALIEAKNEQEKRAAIENLWRKAHKKVRAFDKFRW